MKPKSIISLAAMALCSVLSSCGGGSSDTPKEPDPIVKPPVSEKLEIKISPSIESSRATDYGFESGDKIGLYVVNYNGTTAGTLSQSGNHVDNMMFTYSGTWKPATPIYWLDDETHADFYLYYPYSANPAIDAYKFNVRPDQSVESAFKESDMMFGKVLNVSPTAEATLIPVNHVMSRIVITLEAGNGFTRESLAAATVSVKVNGVKCESTVNLATGAVTATGAATSVVPLMAGDTYKAIIVPQTVAEGNLITVTVNGQEFRLERAFEFKPATSHHFTVALNKTSNGLNVTINPWENDEVDNGGVAE